LQQEPDGEVSDGFIDDLYRLAGREQTGNAHMYVRQGFLDLFDIPVQVEQPEEKIGTHVFTAMHFDEGATRTDWTALTVREQRPRKRKRKNKAAARKVVAKQQVTAREALDRVHIPGYARKHLSTMLTPGSSIVISDKGISGETGKGTDFVVLMR
jgi:hypothetical protein